MMCQRCDSHYHEQSTHSQAQIFGMQNITQMCNNIIFWSKMCTNGIQKIHMVILQWRLILVKDQPFWSCFLGKTGKREGKKRIKKHNFKFIPNNLTLFLLLIFK